MDKDNIQLEAGTLYDMNKAIMASPDTVPPLTHVELAAKQEQIVKWFHKHIVRYGMLLNHELRYFTIFHPTGETDRDLGEEVMGCLKDQQMDILAIDYKKDQDAWEIWLRKVGQHQNVPYVFYLFDYTEGIIEC